MAELDKHEDQWQLVAVLEAWLAREPELTLEGAFRDLEAMIYEYRRTESTPESLQATRLAQLAPLLPKYGYFFTDLPLHQAYLEFDSVHRFSCRMHVQPSADELRQILNIAQCHAIARQLQLVSFDGDDTLYNNRSFLRPESPIVASLLELLDRGLDVALVTAVGYDDPVPYEERLAGLLSAMVRRGLRPEARERLYVMGGECNYAFRCNKDADLEPLPRDLWQTPEMAAWESDDILDLLDAAEDTLRDAARRFNLPMRFVRKERAVGALYVGDPDRTTNLYLDELSLEVRHRLNHGNSSYAPLEGSGDDGDHDPEMGEEKENGSSSSGSSSNGGGGSSSSSSSSSGPSAAKKTTLPYCSFNGGLDVFIDVGNKQIGVECLRKLTGAKGGQTLHFGDQFNRTGNDLLTRRVSSTLWTLGPDETYSYIELLLQDMAGDARRFYSRSSSKR